MKLPKTKQTPIKFSFLNKYLIAFEVSILLLILVFTNSSFHLGEVKSAQIENTEATTSAKLLKPNPSSVPSMQPVSVLPTNFGRSIRVPILMYHYIGKNPNPADKLRDNLSVDPQLFDDQLGYLSKEGFHPITLDTLLAGLSGATTLPPKAIVITFDDGYVDLYVNAFPILKKYGFKSVAFIPTGLIGTAYYASWSQLAEMQSSGLVSMQAHSVHHLSLISVSPAVLTDEITESKKTLEAKFGMPVNFMAYPYGTSNESVWAAVKNAGYLGAAGTWTSAIISEGTLFDMPRIKIPGGLPVSDFASRL
jgi:peptidoglycan/xylan/chitin deacetylase (PgdA/CDA1 family)